MSDNNTEVKHLRGIIVSWQIWADRQIELGLMDEEMMPMCYNRSKQELKRLETESILGKTCFHCSKPLTAKRITEDHVKWFCNEGCLKDYDKTEEQALRRKEHD